MISRRSGKNAATWAEPSHLRPTSVVSSTPISPLADVSSAGRRWSDVADGGQLMMRFGSRARGQADAVRADRRDLAFVDGKSIRRDAWTVDPGYESISESLVGAFAVAAPSMAAPETIPPCTITLGTNEYGSFMTSFLFDGDERPIVVVGEFDADDITTDYMIGLYAWSREESPRCDAAPDEATVQAWLVDHYSHKVKLSQPRIAVLLGLREAYPYLRAPETETIYRGLSNVAPGAAGRLVGMTDPSVDKSWTTDYGQAVKFASGEYIAKDTVNPEKVGAVMHAPADPERMLLNAAAIASLPAVANVIHPIWNEPLGKAILAEREVVVLGPVEVARVEVIPMQRMDAAPMRAAVMIPLPPDQAAKFSDNGQAMPPHVTMVAMEQIDPARLDELALIVADELGYRYSDKGREGLVGRAGLWDGALDLSDVPALSFAGLRYFEKDDVRAAVAQVAVPQELIELRRCIAERLERVGVTVKHKSRAWVPHATLAMIPTGEVFMGPVPTGSWSIDTIEVWSGDEVRYVIGPGAVSGIDKYVLEGGRWVGYREAGNLRVGDYATEEEAREALAADQLTRKLEMKFDARSEAEMADIRERWNSSEGPNMGPARMREWLDSPFSGPNRKAGEDRARARRVSDRALRLIEKPQGEWTDDDYAGAAQVLAYIARAKNIAQGEPLVIDGREGPSARDAALRDWAYDPKADASTSRADKRSAPAVHTESRAHTFDAVRADRIELQNEHAPVFHPDGWVLYPVLYSRGGNIQTYDGVREYRPKDSVFNRTSMDSGIGNPWELRHSADLLNPNTVLGVARGCIVSVEQHSDNEHTFGWAKAWDRRLLEAIEGVDGQRPEAPDVSLAFRCRAHRQPGTDDYGNRFDQWIDTIIWNSLASEPFGRAETARVLTSRADAGAITVHGANELLALANGSRIPSLVYYDRSSWTRFDSARTTPRNDTMTPTNKSIIKAAQALGVPDEDISKALGISVDDLMTMLGSSAELTPDQLNVVVGLLPADPKKSAAPPNEMPPATDAACGTPMKQGDADAEMAPIMIDGTEYMAPVQVANLVTMLENKVGDGEGRADRASKRANDAEGKLAKAEAELTKRADALASMVTRADAEALATAYGTRLANAMDLARQGFGPTFVPESRKDAAGSDVQPSIRDWEVAAIRAAWPTTADAIVARIDKAPTSDARDYAMAEKLIDARDLLASRYAPHDETLRSIERMRADNANKDSSSGGEKDMLAAAAEQRRKDAEQGYVGAPQHPTPGAN